MPEAKRQKPNTAPRHLKTAETPRRTARAERTAAHRSTQRTKQAAPSASRKRHSAERPAKQPVRSGYSGKQLYYDKLLPYAETQHQSYQRSLRAGIRWLFALPVILLVLQKLTNQNKIGILIAWIVGMFIISAALVYVSYSDRELQTYLRSLAEYVPEAEEPSLGNLLPVDENGNWTVNAEQLRRAIAQYRVERSGDISIRLPHELVLQLLPRGEEGRHEKHAAHRP